MNSAAHNQIGTTALADRNVVSGNSVDGVNLVNEDADYNVVQNNLLGLNPAGTAPIKNWKHGLAVHPLASYNVVGGTAPNQHNVSSGNEGNGIQVSHGTLTVENQIIGNFLGTDATGNASPAGFGNGAGGGFGIELHDGPTNNVFSDNVIGGNVSGGIDVRDFDSWGNHIINNRIGIGSKGAALPNGGFGVQVSTNADRVTIGPGNIIANNPEGIILPTIRPAPPRWT